MAKKTHKSPEAARAAILDAAEQVMLDNGPAGLRISAVAKQAGMAHPNIIHHFGSREGLITALAERLGQRATARITSAIQGAAAAKPEDRVAALTHVFDTSYPGDEGRLAVWLHMSGVASSLRQNMESIVEVSQNLRESLDGQADPGNTNRLVMLITLALVGEVVSGPGIKDALGFGSDEESRAHFRQWLAEIILNLDDEHLKTSFSNPSTPK